MSCKLRCDVGALVVVIVVLVGLLVILVGCSSSC